MKKNLAWLAAGLILAAAVSGCGHKYVSARADRGADLAGIGYVAILPFENMTNFPEAGKIVPDLLATELYISRAYRVMERTEAVAAAAEQGIRVEDPIDAETARRLGEKLGVDGVIFGSVSEYWYRVYREEDEEVEPAVGFSARLVSVATGEVVWSASVTRSSYDLLFSRRDPLNRVAQLAVIEMVRTLL